MNKIANEIPSNPSDLVKWYDFLWSRTRSIRKDITQQMLNDKVAVDLVEKCASFMSLLPSACRASTSLTSTRK
uniref:SAC3/GANP/THP3 conserved domain-containing protein n=1 Tax=Ditylenchus dipsaci TaxID=166011 RepID=A0A915CX22_9BILA